MTALIYKAALPTYTSLADLNANAGESLLLNDAGTAYELEPAQSGATVPDSIWLGSDSFVANDGTPTRGFVSNAPAFLMDAALYENIGAVIPVPQGWVTFDLDVYWANKGAGAGAVTLYTLVSQWTNGAANADIGSQSTTIITVGTQGVFGKTTTKTGVVVPAAAQLLQVDITRSGEDVADTLANDFAIFGAMLRKAT